jgi:hypothetical protein
VPAFSADNDDRDRRPRAEARTDIDKLIRDVNALDNRGAANRAGLTAVSRETAVPLPRIERSAQEHPRVGIAGVFMAHELATKTQKPADQYFKQHADGKTWSELARASGQNLDVFERKLARIETALRDGTADRSRVRERGERARDRSERLDRNNQPANRTGIERRVDAVNALDDSAKAKRAGLTAMSKETAVPLPTVEEAERGHPNAGLGDLFVAQELATKTQKSVSELLGLHRDGKSWAEIAASHNQDISSVEQKLSRVEEAMRNAQ